MISHTISILSLLLFFSLHTNTHPDYLEVYKHGVLYRFVHNENTDNFVLHRFPNWERETFEVFDQVKDPNSIAIDLGAWIGTTAIWLSKNFDYVIAVDADKESLRCLKANLKASECNNVAICENAIAHEKKEVIFGSRSNILNNSVSYIKDQSDQDHDYTVQAITLHELVESYIKSDPLLQNKKISFIKCDIEGGEEDIIEDLLTFAYDNNIKVYLSFHLDWWPNRKITDFQELFKKFKVDCPNADVCRYITQNPFESVLFEPIVN